MLPDEHIFVCIAISSAERISIGSFGGLLKSLPATRLVAIAIKGISQYLEH
jgi:hypothetical protein